jgi:hypothetical protein
MSVDYPDWTSLRALVNAIAVAGVPLLRGTNGLASSAGVTVPHLGGINLFTNGIIVQPSFEARFTAHYPLGTGTSPFLVFIVTWSNSATNTTTDVEKYAIPVGNGSGMDVQVYLSGPCRGDRMSVFCSGTDTVADATLTYAFNQTSNIHSHDRLFQPSLSPNPPIGFVWPSGDPAFGIMYNMDTAIAPSTNLFRLMPVWNGKARVSVDNGSGQGNVSFSFQDPANLYGLSGGFGMEKVFAAGTRDVFEVQFPNGPVNILIRNEDPVNVNTPAVFVLREEY